MKKKEIKKIVKDHNVSWFYDNELLTDFLEIFDRFFDIKTIWMPDRGLWLVPPEDTYLLSERRTRKLSIIGKSKGIFYIEQNYFLTKCLARVKERLKINYKDSVSVILLDPETIDFEMLN